MVESTTLKAGDPTGLPAGLPSVGEVVGEKYRITRMLGAGGMGFVVAAENIALHQRVAMKFLAPEATRNLDAIERFLREARASVRIRNEHVAQVYDVGTTKEGTPYLVMEMLEGEDLGAVLARRGPLPTEQVASYMLQACTGLAAAHVRGIVHRDLKPSNLFLTRRDDGSELVKIIDFGIAKAIEVESGRSAASITDTRAVMGSPAYMSPEQIRSTKNVDARTDVWSLGVVLYELLTNKIPFEGPTGAAVLASVAADPPAAMPESIPQELRDTVLRCLIKDPAKRIASAGMLAMELAPHCPGGQQLAERALRTEEGRGLSQAPPAASSNPPGGGQAALARTVGQTGAGRAPRTKALTLVAALTLAAGLGWVVLRASVRAPSNGTAATAGPSAPPSAALALPAADAAVAPAATPVSASAEPTSIAAVASTTSSSAKPPARRAPSTRPRAATPDNDDPAAGSH